MREAQNDSSTPHLRLRSGKLSPALLRTIGIWGQTSAKGDKRLIIVVLPIGGILGCGLWIYMTVKFIKKMEQLRLESKRGASREEKALIKRTIIGIVIDTLVFIIIHFLSIFSLYAPLSLPVLEFLVATLMCVPSMMHPLLYTFMVSTVWEDIKK